MKNNKTFEKTFFIWLLDKNSKKQEISYNEAFKIVQKLVVSNFGGGTISKASGVYKHNDWTLIEEVSIRVEVITDKDHLSFVNTVKQVLNQESVLYKEASINFDFI